MAGADYTSPQRFANLLMLGGSLGFALMGVLAKALPPEIGSFQTALFRNLVSFLIIAPFHYRDVSEIIKTAHWKLHFLRGITGSVASVTLFYAFHALPLATATAYSFTTPIFMLALAPFLLKERVTVPRIIFALIGFFGILLITSADLLALPLLSHTIGLTQGLSLAVTMALVKLLRKGEKDGIILVIYAALTTLLVAAPAAVTWVPMDMPTLGLIIIVGMVGSLSQLLMIKAFRRGDASKLSLLDYSRLVAAVLLGWIIYQEPISGSMVLGIAIVVLAAYLSVLPERAFRRQPENR